jgi:hypothetical protein
VRGQHPGRPERRQPKRDAADAEVERAGRQERSAQNAGGAGARFKQPEQANACRSNAALTWKPGFT